jgi:hypothetical protein
VEHGGGETDSGEERVGEEVDRWVKCRISHRRKGKSNMATTEPETEM